MASCVKAMAQGGRQRSGGPLVQRWVLRLGADGWAGSNRSHRTTSLVCRSSLTRRGPAGRGVAGAVGLLHGGIERSLAGWVGLGARVAISPGSGAILKLSMIVGAATRIFVGERRGASVARRTSGQARPTRSTNTGLIGVAIVLAERSFASIESTSLTSYQVAAFILGHIAGAESPFRLGGVGHVR